MNVVSRVQHVALAFACVAWLVACGGGPPKPTAAKAELVAAADVNPDAGGRASPIVVRVYQLKEAGAFSGADFFTLFEKEQETLGASLLGREEFALQPGEKRELEIKVAPEAQFVAAAAAFRDIRNAKWRVLTPAPEKGLTDLLRKDKLTITVARSEITLALGK
jgi:type VI secretion system protein VasD